MANNGKKQLGRPDIATLGGLCLALGGILGGLLIEGGKLCDPANLRTLCVPCHKQETAALAKRRAVAQRDTRCQPMLIEISPA